MILLNAQQRWVCPNCASTEVTVGQPNRFHHCAGLLGFLAPMVLEGVRCKVVSEEREDYLAGADVRRDGNGRPIMAVRTVRDDGEDLAVYAPTAHVRMVG